MGLVDARQAAKALGVSPFTLYRYAKQHRLPAYRCGKALRFDVDEVRDWMRQKAAQEVVNAETQ